MSLQDGERKSSSYLDDLIARVAGLPPDKRDQVNKMAAALAAKRKFIPHPGPQTEALRCKADELFYGGAAGGGKSALLCGLAIDDHQHSILYRREFPQIKGLLDIFKEMLGSYDGYNQQNKLWKLPGGKECEFGSVQHEDDKEKYQGRAHDFVGFDEITHFPESIYRFLIGWTRSSRPNQRCRVVVAGNPPMTAEGAWVIKYWGPWLDPTHKNPAKPGELRWFTTIAGETREMDGPGPHQIDGREVYAKSRTFIPARLEDNPILFKGGYASDLEAMPEPMRTMLREGRFDVSQNDQAFQVIPTAWIVSAQNRWKADGHKDFGMTAMALDPAGGGRDSAELCWRHGGWYAPLWSAKGEMTADGSSMAGMVIAKRRNNAPVIVDVGGGYGGAVTERLKDNGVPHVRFNGANTAGGLTVGSKQPFVNKRAEAWWRFREALDPDQEGWSVIALPTDPELRADLAAPIYKPGVRGIQIENKDELRKRLGRSPGKGDSVIMCWSSGDAAVRRELRNNTGRQTLANIGFSSLKKLYGGRT
jgi:hypothetical protein